MATKVNREKPAKSVDDIGVEIAEKEIKFVRLLFSDWNGVPKGKTLMAEYFLSVIEDEDGGENVDGSSIEGFARDEESDMVMRPDLPTFRLMPCFPSEHGNIAVVICDIYLPNGRPFAGDPRFILKKALAKVGKRGWTYLTGAENEYHYLEKDGSGNIPIDQGGYFNIVTDKGFEARLETANALEEIGIYVEGSHHEVASGQQEMVLRFDDALTTADNILLLDIVIKAIAEKYDFIAVTMPKVKVGEAGNGRHVHENFIDKEGDNIFYDPDDPYNLSEIAYLSMGGQIYYARDLCLMTNGNVNSYKRLVIEQEAPVYVSWARRNRSAFIRVPHTPPSATRLEFRCPDTQSNVYLVFAAMLEASIAGIEEKIKPPPPVEKNIYKMTVAQRAKKKIITLPENMFEAICCFRESELAKKIMGKAIHQRFCEVKMKEWRQFHDSQVTKWEIEKYLHN